MHTIVRGFGINVLPCAACDFIFSSSRCEYWEHLLSASGCPKCRQTCVIKGHAELMQSKEATTSQEKGLCWSCRSRKSPLHERNNWGKHHFKWFNKRGTRGFPVSQFGLEMKRIAMLHLLKIKLRLYTWFYGLVCGLILDLVFHFIVQMLHIYILIDSGFQLSRRTLWICLFRARSTEIHQWDDRQKHQQPQLIWTKLV